MRWATEASLDPRDRDEIVLPGEVVSPINPPDGDVFQTRTPMNCLRLYALTFHFHMQPITHSENLLQRF